MNYRDYKNARDAAWQILLDCGVDQLPVRTSMLCRKLGIGLAEDDLSQDGYSIIVCDEPYIVVKRSLGDRRKRFTVAHEIGHILLGHVGKYELVNREPSSTDSPIEREANVFASRLLAPACVLWGCGVRTAEEIAELCDISHQAALIRAKRMEELYRRNKFLQSPLEREVYRHFLPFIYSRSR